MQIVIVEGPIAILDTCLCNKEPSFPFLELISRHGEKTHFFPVNTNKRKNQLFLLIFKLLQISKEACLQYQTNEIKKTLKISYYS